MEGGGDDSISPAISPQGRNPRSQVQYVCMCECVFRIDRSGLNHVYVFVAMPFILDVRLVDAPARATQEECHTGFLHLPFCGACLNA